MGFVRKLLCLVLLLTLGVWLRWPSPGVLDGKCEARYLASSTTERFGSVECRLGVLQHHALSFTVRDCGDPHAAAIVLLHGFPDDYGTWEHQIEPLVSQARRRVLVPVLRGYEPSSQPRTMWYRPISSGLANGYHATALASDLVCLLDALQLDRADVLGHDWGAVIAHLAGGLYPERINKLVTIAVPPQFATDTAGVARVAPSQLRNSWYMLFFQLPVIPELALQYGHVLHKLLSDWSPSFSWPSHRHAHIVSLTFQLPGVVEASIAYYRANIPGLLIAPLYKLLGWENDPLVAASRKPIVPPLLLITGADDGCIDTKIFDLPMAKKNVEVVRVPGAGHFAHYEKPQLVNKAILSWLASDDRR